MRLRRTQICPIHHSRFCCGREGILKKGRTYQMGVRRVDDPASSPRIPRAALERGDAEAAGSQDYGSKRHLRYLQREVHRL